ncbi:MAG: peptidylprolyl isomerase, partial [Betaproteobacteria bacterium]|nr:peptidylprolyl isomerase [Betaproteobacteria bacterium]
MRIATLLLSLLMLISRAAQAADAENTLLLQLKDGVVEI